MAAVLVILHFVWLIAAFGFDWKQPTVKALFDLATESNVGTWLSAFVLFANAVVAGLIAMRASRRDRSRWALIAAMFLVFSIDEVGAVHEAIGAGLSDHLHTHGALRYTWVIPGALAIVLLAIVLVPFVLRQPVEVARPLMAGAIVYVGGALGVELLEGWLDDRQSVHSFLNTFVRGSQEVLEMIGMLLGLWALLGAAGQIELSIGTPSTAPPQPTS